jgi:hypothetical protein
VALALLLALAAPVGPAPAVIRYEVVEVTRSLTPAGARETALAATVTALQGKARWELSATRFPGVTARVALGDRDRVTFLDPDEFVAASASWEEFAELFTRAKGPEGMSAEKVRDLSASVVREGAGEPLGGFPTRRFRVACAFTVVVSQPGRVARVKHTVSGAIEAVEELAAVRTPFDDLLRLFRVRGEAREALAKELAKVTGLPVRVRLDAESESAAEVAGAAGGEAGMARPPVRSTSTTTRAVSGFVRRAQGEGDDALFAVPESYRSRSLERLRIGGPKLP